MNYMSMGEAIISCFTKYFDFRSRASRSEFWWFMLFQVMIGVVFVFVPGAALLYGVASIVFYIPNFSVTARRLHDVDESGWWQLAILTVIGIIPVLYWLTKEGDGNNRFGEKEI